MRGISDHFGIVSDMRVAIAPVNGCFTSGLTTLLDVLQTAEGMRRSLNAEIPSIDVEIGGFSDTVVTRNGLSADVTRRLDREGCAGLDVLVVPSLGAGASADALEHALGREDIHRLIDVLRETPLPPVVAAACSGTFVLAQAGLLDGHLATTSWFLAGRSSAGIRVSASTCRGWSSAAARSSPPVPGSPTSISALSLVSGLSRELASMVASYMLIDERPSASLDLAQSYLGSVDPLLTDFETWVRTHLSEPIKISDAVTDLGTTRKTLERRARERARTTPHAIVQRIRVEQAIHLRRTTNLNMTQIARAVGYRNASTLRELIRSETP